MLYVDTNNNTNNNKQKVKNQNINKETEADLLVARKVCERNDYDISAGDFVVVQYDENRNCGQVIDINNNENTIPVNLRKECENVQHKFKWPTSEDIDWVDFDEIVKKVDVSVATTKAGRMFAFSEDDLDLLNDGCDDV